MRSLAISFDDVVARAVHAGAARGRRGHVLVGQPRQAIALAARPQGVKAVVVMPHDAP
jgi:hypothetical protein